jgi:hypothetical protein
VVNTRAYDKLKPLPPDPFRHQHSAIARSKRRSLATDMVDAIFTHPLLAEGLNTLFAMFDG